MTVEFVPVTVEMTEVPVWKREKMMAKAVKVNRRLSKMGVPPVAFDFGDIIVVERTDDMSGVKYEDRLFATVTLTGSEARHGGYHPVASLDHTVDPDEAWVSMFPGAIESGEELPEQFRHSGPACDHCGIKIARNKTVVFAHEDGHFRQVGSTCFGEFFGVDPTIVLNVWEDMLTDDDDEEWGGGGGGFEKWTVKPAVFLAAAAAITEAFGFVPTRCDFDQEPTRDAVRAFVAGRWSKADKERFADIDVTAFESKADEIMAWVAADESDSDFMHSAGIACGQAAVHWKTEGLLAALPRTFERAMGRIAEKAAADAAKVPSEFVGTVGEKIEVVGTVTASFTVDTQFGTSKRLSVTTDAGEVVTTFGSGSSLFGPERGDRVRWTGKVKDHTDDAKWGKQTACKMVKIVPLDENDEVEITFAHWCEEAGCPEAVMAPADSKKYVPFCPAHTPPAPAAPVLGEKPANWDEMTPGKKAAWTRAAKKEAAA